VRVAQVEPVQASPTRFPPPAALLEQIIVTRVNVMFRIIRSAESTNLEHAGTIQQASVIISVVSREWTVV
jgi:hypothetical protein